MAKKTRPKERKKREKAISLYPLSPEEAIKRLLLAPKPGKKITKPVRP